MPPPSKAGPFVSTNDTHLSLLSVKSTIPKAISLVREGWIGGGREGGRDGGRKGGRKGGREGGREH